MKIERETKIKRISKAVSLALIVTTVNIPLAFAEEGSSEGNATQDEKVQVTGTRIRRDEFASPSPIQVLKIEDAKKSGMTSVSEMLLNLSLTNGQQLDSTYNSNSGNSNATEAPPAGGVGSTNVGLRGLGPERTLILINGRRLGASGVRGAPSQPDISMIPFEMVDRIEVLSDSASAIYGADAVAGVINIILRDSFDGAQFTATISKPSDKGGSIKQFSFVTGGSSDKSSFVFGGEFYDRERIALGDRIDCIKDRYRNVDNGDIYSYCRSGFPDNAAIAFDGDLSSPTGSAWNFFTPGISDLINPITGDAIDNWSSTANLPSSFPCYSTGAPCTINATGNERFRLNSFYNDQKERLNSDLVQPATRFSLYAKGSYSPEWGEQTNGEVYYETAYFHRHLTNTPAAEQMFVIQPHLIPQEDANGNLLVNPDGSWQLFNNPMNPFGSTVLNVVTFDQLNQTRDVELDHFRAVLGARGDFGGEWMRSKGWNWDLSMSYDRGAGAQDQPIINEDRLALSLETQRLDVNGNVVCGYLYPQNAGQGFISPADCVPFDLWNPNLYNNEGSLSGAITDAEAAYLIGDRVNHTVVEQKMFQAFMGGELFNFENGGTANIALGAEIRYDSIASRADMLSATGGNAGENPSTEGKTAGTRNVKEYYAEVNLPVLQNMPGVERLEFDLALRHTSESNFGSQDTERFRVLYAPNDWTTISAAYGTSFRAPNLREQFLGDQFDGVGGGSDPCNVNNAGAAAWDGTTYTASADIRPAEVLAYCNSVGSDPSLVGSLGTTTVPVRIGGNVFDLDPETSEQTTVTLKMVPYKDSDYSFDFALTYFDIEIKDTIQSPSASQLMYNCAYLSQNCGRVVRDPSPAAPAQAFPLLVDASFVNSGVETSVGYDLNTRFSMNFNDMELIWNTQLTVQEERTQQFEDTDDSPVLDIIGNYGTPKKRFVNTLRLLSGDFQYTLNSRHFDQTGAGVNGPSSCRNSFENTTLVETPTVVRVCNAPGQWIHDISMSWTPNETFTATIGVGNLLDEEPPLITPGAGSNRGGRVVSSGYDQVGRTLFANMSYRF